MSEFDAITDEQRRREAHLFVGGMTAGANVGATILHGLVAMGIFTKEVARSLLDDGQRATANIELPSGYEHAIEQLFSTLTRAAFDRAS